MKLTEFQQINDKTIIAVDFDGTLCESNYPLAGAPNMHLLDSLRILKRKKHVKIILWTCRTGENLEFAVNWCKEHGLIFDAVNENLPDPVTHFGGDCRKVYADFYIDDKNIGIYDLLVAVACTEDNK